MRRRLHHHLRASAKQHNADDGAGNPTHHQQPRDRSHSVVSVWRKDIAFIRERIFKSGLVMIGHDETGDPEQQCGHPEDQDNRARRGSTAGSL
ncbi:MAG: hypothetical protein WD827_08020 [Solirubrobacterales bacterium]